MAAVHDFLQVQGFTVEREVLFDETGRPGAPVRKDLLELEKHVLAWFRAYRAGSKPEELYSYLAGRFSREEVRRALDLLVKGGELAWKAGRLVSGVPRPGPLVLPCPVRLDLYGYRGTERVERWGVECKGSRETREGKRRGAEIACGIGQAHLYSRVCDRAFLAIPSEWPRLYEEESQKSHFRLALLMVAKDLGFSVLVVADDGRVRQL